MIKHSEAMKNKEKKPTLSEAFEMWVNEQLDKRMVTCFKCHGKGAYDVPAFDDETFSPSLTEWESRPCEICRSTGKIPLEFYEELQRKMREKE